MADDFSDGLIGSDDGGQSLKASEITGDRFLFHSLPKEFQDWHTTYFIMEQRMVIDSNIVSKAVLNGYMWKVLFDATAYAISLCIIIILSVLKLKFSPNIAGLGITLLIYIPLFAYIVYHIKFYSLIKAQAIGEVTTNAKKNISDVYFSSFYAVSFSLIVAFLFVMAFLDDIALLFAELVMEIDQKDLTASSHYLSFLRDWLVSTHNLIADLLNGPENGYGTILFNHYIMTSLFLGVSYIIILYSDKYWYSEHKIEVDKEILKAKAQMGYPIEAALECLWNWREKHGV